MADRGLTKAEYLSALKYMDEVAIPVAQEATAEAEVLAMTTNGAAARARAENLQRRLVSLRIRRMMLSRDQNARA